MHVTKMILTHFAICRTAEFVLHHIWAAIKERIELVLATFTFCLISPIIKPVEQFCRGLGFVAFLIVCGLISSATIKPAHRNLC
jgi:hypothetical protein